ncbi:DUF4349 domain-containing protein [uncultured Chitinophaga sp.]|jgi:hypothetical protein|uniref:DUF4349 domain-containing protein n=1 Tax=uncultured Chitinophaga sp. TaxID=339340 RepID=UPI00262F7D41|nr:DUF4349 domain-containing protein [uncultured Chitinophaga sp.]
MRPLLCYLLLGAITLVACQANMEKRVNASEPAAAYEIAADSTQFSNDIAALNSPSRKRIRTADVRCRVNNVFNATAALEQAVLSMNGVIVESTMRNSFGRLSEAPYSADSMKRIQLYTPTAYLTLRVPAAGLDSIVRILTAMSSFIEHRTLKEQDKTLDYLSNALKNKDTEKNADQLSPGKNSTPLDVAAYQDAKRNVAIDRRIINLGILDDVNYATFSVQLFQPEVADIQVVVDPGKVVRAGFGAELLSAAGDGVEIFRNVFIFLLRLWPFWIAGAAGWYLYRRKWGNVSVK